MQSKAKTASEYLEEVPAKRQEALIALRHLCLETLTGFQESMEYGMPSYSRNGEVEVSFMSQKQYISLYILRQGALESQRSALVGINVGKGCIRYTKPEKINFDVVKQMLIATRESQGEIC